MIRHPAICHLGEPPESDMAPLAGDVLKNMAGEYQPFNRRRSEIGDGTSLEKSGPSYRANWRSEEGAMGDFVQVQTPLPVDISHRLAASPVQV